MNRTEKLLHTDLLPVLFLFMLVSAAPMAAGIPMTGAQPAGTFSPTAVDFQSCDVRFTVVVNGTPLSVAVQNDLEITGLSPGETMSYVPDATGGFLVPQFAAREESDIPALVRVHGDPNGSVLVSFTLPVILYPLGGVGSVRLDFNGTSAAWGSPGSTTQYFNPKLPEKINLNTDGDCDISLGCIATVSSDASADDYSAVGIVTVAYSGN